MTQQFLNIPYPAEYINDNKNLCFKLLQWFIIASISSRVNELSLHKNWTGVFPTNLSACRQGQVRP